MKVNRKKLETVLLLIEDNIRTAASKIGLEHRKKNLNEIQDILKNELKLSDEEIESMYWVHIDSRE